MTESIYSKEKETVQSHNLTKVKALNGLGKPQPPLDPDNKVVLD